MIFEPNSSQPILILQVTDLANKAHGYVGADLHSLANQAALCALRRHAFTSKHEAGGVTVDEEDVDAAWLMVKPSALREITLEIPQIKWTDIGGQEDIKRKIKEAVELPFKDAALIQQYGGNAPKGKSSMEVAWEVGPTRISHKTDAIYAHTFISSHFHLAQASCCMDHPAVAKPCWPRPWQMRRVLVFSL